LNASLINLTSLIQKLLEENKKNNQENDLSNASSSNNLLLNSDINNIQNSKNKGIEVNKKNTNTTSNTNYSSSTNNANNNTTALKKNITNQILNNSITKNNNSTFYSNINMNTMSNLKGLNLATKWNKEQDENNNNSNEHSEVIENKNKPKNKNKKKNNRNEYNKSLNSFDFRKTSIYNLASKKIETAKNAGNKKVKIETSFKKINSKKVKNTKNRSNSRNRMNSKEPTDLVEENKIKEENKESYANKNNKGNKMNGGNNSNFNQITHMRKSFQKLSININGGNNQGNRKRSRSRSNQNKSLIHCHTKANLRSKNKPSINLNFSNANNTTYNNVNKEALMEKLSNLEKSYYILSKSPVLRLKERLFFARSTQNLRNIQSVPDILKKNETFLKEKIKELEGEISECDKRINTAFNPSKTAEINFNFILSKDEDEFKNFVWFAENENEKNEYYGYLKLFYLLFNESYENIELKNLSEKLYVALSNRGYKTIKEYLYDIYFKKKDNNNIVYNIDKINNLLNEEEIDEKINGKFCRFALFTSFLVKEIIKYGNDVKNMVELKIKTKEFIDVINNKLKLYKMANTFKK
jgi:hypothetical protein